MELPEGMSKYEPCNEATINSFRARLKDRDWMIVQIPKSSTNMLGAIFKGAIIFQVAEYVSPCFLIGSKKQSEGFFLENVNYGVFTKWCAISRVVPFVSNQGYIVTTEDNDMKMEPLNWDHLHVGDFLDKRFDHGYFIVGADAKVILLKEELPSAANDIFGVGVKQLVAFGVPNLEGGMTCSWCGA